MRAGSSSELVFDYVVDTLPVAPPSNQFFAVSLSDIDGDGTLNVWGLQKPNLQNVFGVASSAPAPGCAVVLNRQLTLTTGANVAMQHQVGPCDNANNGLEVF